MRGENKFLRIIQVSVLLFSFFRPIRLQFGLKIRGGGGGGEGRSLAPPLDPPLGFSFKIDFYISGPVQVSSGRFLKYYSSFSGFTDLNPSESGQNSSSLIVLFSTLKRSNYRIYSINRPGRLLNFWTLRGGAYSRLGAY